MKTWLLSRVLPPKVKRMVFISSLAAYIKQLDEVDDYMADQLNLILGLTDDSRNLRLPMHFSTSLWKGSDKELLETAHCSRISDLTLRGLTLSESRKVANIIISRAPKWLIYTSKTKLREEIYKLFLSLEIIQARV